MNKWQKIGLAVGMGTAVITTTHLINSIIFKSSTANNYTGKRIRSNYQWKFGNIAYITAGSGSPLLLIHDLNSYSSSYEWEQTINSFARITRFTLLIYWDVVILINLILLIQHLCIHSLSMISCSMLFVPRLMLLLQQAQHQL